MKAIVAGGTGLVGAALLQELSKQGATTTAVARRAGPAVANVTWLVRDLAQLDANDLSAADATFCCLGTTIKKAGTQEAFRAVDHGLVLRFAEAARRRGVSQFHVVSALGADAGSRIFYNRVKGEMEQDVESLHFPTLCIYRPSLIMGERAERRSAERLAMTLAKMAAPILPRRVRGVDASAIARAMLRLAQESPPGTRVILSDEIATLGA